MDERRTSYRVSSDGSMSAELHTDLGRWSGEVVDTSHGGVRVAFPRAGAPVLAIGSGNLDLTLSGAELAEPVTLACTVRARSETDEATEYGLGFRDARQVSRLLPAAAQQHFNRRREPRISPPPVRGSWVELQVVDGAHRGRRAMGALVDVSAAGLGMLLDLSTEEIVADSPTITCTFAAPGRTGKRARGGRIVNRALQGEQVRYGVSFVPPEPGLPKKEAYEAAWDCVVCGTRLLLAQSHVHCPGCGTSREGMPTYFPRWEEAELNTEHWAWGDDRPCPYCDVSHSYLATFCGRCGRPLP